MPSGAEEVFDPLPVLEEFSRAGVDFVVIGGVAGGAHGSSFGTFDIDLAVARQKRNLTKVAKVLSELGAELRGATKGLPFLLDAKTLAAGANFTFTTRLGDVDIIGDPAGAPSYDQLKAKALTIDVRGYPVRIASLDDLIAMKEAAGRPKDLNMASEYRVLADEARKLRKKKR
jgi:hypothetical protein